MFVITIFFEARSHCNGSYPLLECFILEHYFSYTEGEVWIVQLSKNCTGFPIFSQRAPRNPVKSRSIEEREVFWLEMYKLSSYCLYE